MTGPARIAVLSGMGIERAIFWRNFAPPIESALASRAGVTVVAPPPFRRATFRSDRPAWLAAIRTLRKADAVFWIQFHLHPPLPVWALAYVRPLAHRAVLGADIWEPAVHDFARVVDAQRIRTCFVEYREAFDALRSTHAELPLVWLPMGFNQEVFHDKAIDRDIYVFWMGRRHAPLHEALLRHCLERGLRYEFLEPPDQPISTVELNERVSRCRYFVVTPPDVSDRDRTGSFSPLTSRYLEGIAAGATLLGVPPGSGELEEMVPDAPFVEVASDGSDLALALDRADRDPQRDARARAASDLVRRECGWDKRAQFVYKTIMERIR